MALSSSGSISMSQIQSEWGGSNPISMSEYYSGALQADDLSDSQSISISSGSNTVTTPATKLIGAYTTYYYTNGWKNTNIENSSNRPALGSNSATFSKISGTDSTGNSGAIPASGAIDMNKFRGTAKGTSSSITCYGWYNYLGTNSISSAHFMSVWIAGHYGASTENAGSWTSVPFRYIDTTAEGSSLQMPATRWYGSDTNVANGANLSQSNKFHFTYPNIGNVTEFRWNCPSNVVSGSILYVPYRNFSGTVTMTFQF